MNTLSKLLHYPQTFSSLTAFSSLAAKMNPQIIIDLLPPSPTTILKTLAVLLLLLNVKSLPLVWHLRFYHALYTHLFRRKTKYPTPSQLFAPISTTSRPSLHECDVNMHKSNSSYFSDLDINRSHLIAHLIKKSLQVRRAKGEKAMYVALAGVCALFRREIKPGEKYEVRSRVLGWDAKWLFVVSHFVKIGGSKKGSSNPGGAGTGGGTTEDSNAAKRIFASSLSKYVFKQGRKTIPPEEVLRESGLLPERPAGFPAPDYSASNPSNFSSSEQTRTNTPIPATGDISSSTVLVSPPSPIPIPGGGNSPKTLTKRHSPSNSASVTENYYETVVDKVLEKSLEVNVGDGKAEWTYTRIERERKRGMEIAKCMLGLDALDGEMKEVEKWGMFSEVV